MNRLKLVEKYARVWNTAPWAERLMWRQQEMHYMWNSNHAYDGGAFYRQMAKFTERCNPERKEDTWGHYHPATQERDENGCRLFEMTKKLPNYGVGRLVYNAYERTNNSLNYERLNGTLVQSDGSIAPRIPDTMWLITRAWYDWNTPNTDQVTKQSHLGNFGYAYGIMFHYGETDGLEREFVDHNLSGWRMVPREFEEKYLQADFEVHIPNEFSDVRVSPVIEQRLLFEEAVKTGVPENRLSVDKIKLKEK